MLSLSQRPYMSERLEQDHKHQDQAEDAGLDAGLVQEVVDAALI